jgi:hypothetical protein
MSDNLLLTVLGMVGVGALIMGMNQNDNKKSVKEDFLNFPLQKTLIKEVGNRDGQLSSVNYAQAINSSLGPSISEVQRMNRQGIPQDAQLARLQSQAMSKASQQQANFSRAIAPQQTSNFSKVMGPVENYASPSELGLGSAAVTRNDYVSYPQFNQSTPLQSPSLNLPAQIRYNPPSLDKMGITNAYQSQPMDYAGLVEGYTHVQGYEKNPEGRNLYGGQVNIGSGNISNVSNFLSAVDNGTKKYSGGDTVTGSLPLSSMDSGVVNDPSASNTMYFDRLVYSTGKLGGHRSGGVSGVSDLIRGDLAVCVDPCQKGWFQSSAQPKDLRTGALTQIGGLGSASSNSDTQRFARESGNLNASTGNQGQTAQLSVLQKALAGSQLSSSIISSSSFA